ncbi:MAG: adenylyltransferase/cytidyltransferase family protein [Opitutales bacterium]
MSLDEAVSRREKLRGEKKSFVLTNGCFDLLHAGHIFLLEKTSALADELWVAVNSDSSARSLKGNNRPIQGERARAYALLCLEFVDVVLLFHGERLDQEIRALQPDVYAKGGDYSIDTIDPGERDALQSARTRIQFIPFLDGYGTTDLIRRIKELPDD